MDSDAGMPPWTVALAEVYERVEFPAREATP